ncbi:uncharacterized protein LOC143044489 [Mytilus galloprovincialis]|uniref:uncharacterized protein LOC143044489 n=1 Tax=Mytilus galloprovincialis TaxID=29158 RepID=UPI003F7C4FBD
MKGQEHKMNFASFGILLALLPSVFALRCLKCNQQSTVNLCTDIVTCDDITEECYLEKVTTANLQLVFNGGCRSKQVCTLLQSLGFGKKRATSCSKCCNADQCNANLCQENLAPADHCCDQNGLKHFSECTHFLQCQDDEACSLKMFIRNQDIVYDLGCEKRVLCLKGGDSFNFGEVIVPTQTKKDQLPDDMKLCQACCRGDQCNVQYATCGAMLHSMVPANFTR